MFIPFEPSNTKVHRSTYGPSPICNNPSGCSDPSRMLSCLASMLYLALPLFCGGILSGSHPTHSFSSRSSSDNLPRSVLSWCNSLIALLSLLLPLLRCVAFRRPSMNSRNLRLQHIINQSMPCQRSLLFELRGDYHCRKCLAAAS